MAKSTVKIPTAKKGGLSPINQNPPSRTGVKVAKPKMSSAKSPKVGFDDAMYKPTRPGR